MFYYVMSQELKEEQKQDYPMKITNINKFDVNLCEIYARNELLHYCYINGIRVKKNVDKFDLCCILRRHYFLNKFLKNHVEYTRFKGYPYHIYISLLYIKSLNIPDLDIYIPSFNQSLTVYNLCIVWNVNNNLPNYINIPNKFVEFLENSDKKYVIVLLGYWCEYDTQNTQNRNKIYDDNINFNFYNQTNINYEGHMNLLIFNKDELTIQRFEPHGKNTPDKYCSKMLDNTLRSLFTEYKYISSEEYCPIAGPQYYQNLENSFKPGDPSGFCVSWVIWYIEFIFNYRTYFDLPHNKLLVYYFIILKKLSFTKLIRNYSEHIFTFGEELYKSIYFKP